MRREHQNTSPGLAAAYQSRYLFSDARTPYVSHFITREQPRTTLSDVDDSHLLGYLPYQSVKSMLTHDLVLERMASQNPQPDHGLTLCQKSLSTNQYAFRVFHWLNLLLADVNICKLFATDLLLFGDINEEDTLPCLHVLVSWGTVLLSISVQGVQQAELAIHYHLLLVRILFDVFVFILVVPGPVLNGDRVKPELHA